MSSTPPHIPLPHRLTVTTLPAMKKTTSNRRSIPANSLAWRVRDKRRKKDWTQAQLAAASSHTTDAIAKIETGKILRPRKIAELARALDTTESYLFFGDEGKVVTQFDESFIDVFEEVSAFLAEQRLPLSPRSQAKLSLAVYHMLQSGAVSRVDRSLLMSMRGILDKF